MECTLITRYDGSGIDPRPVLHDCAVSKKIHCAHEENSTVMGKAVVNFCNGQKKKVRIAYKMLFNILLICKELHTIDIKTTWSSHARIQACIHIHTVLTGSSEHT